MTSILFLCAGLVLLIVGGELLVRGSVRVASSLGVSPLLIGLTLVGFGTSTPELVTSVQASLVGSPGIAVGNIVGSNIANILLILGIAALIAPMTINSRALARDGSFAVIVAVLLLGCAWTLGLARPVGIGLVALLVAYMVYAFRQERMGAAGHTAGFEKASAATGVDPNLAPQSDPRPAGGAIMASLIMAVAGLAVIIVGGRLLVSGAVDLARLIGMSEAVIGLTIVSVGTSLPELVTSVIAALRRQADVAFGNIVGSNIYNVLGIGGVTALLAPTEVPLQIAQFDAPIMVAASALLLVFAWTGLRLSRTEGAALLALYCGYLAWLVGGA